MFQLSDFSEVSEKTKAIMAHEELLATIPLSGLDKKGLQEQIVLMVLDILECKNAVSSDHPALKKQLRKVKKAAEELELALISCEGMRELTISAPLDRAIDPLIMRAHAKKNDFSFGKTMTMMVEDIKKHQKGDILTVDISFLVSSIADYTGLIETSARPKFTTPAQSKTNKKQCIKRAIKTRLKMIIPVDQRRKAKINELGALLASHFLDDVTPDDMAHV